MTHIERLPQGEGRLAWSRTILIILLAGAAGLYAHWVVPEQIALAITIAAWSIVVFLVARLAVGLIAAIDMRFMNHQIAEQQLAQGRALADKAAAEARQADRDAKVLVVTAKYDEQILIRDLEHVEWLKAHLDPRTYANGAPTPPTPLEIAVYQLFHQPRALPASSASPLLGLPAGTPGYELPSMVRWFDVVPGRRGDLNNLVLGLRLNERGQLAPLAISLYDLFHTIAAASSGWGKSAFISAILAQLATCPDPVEFVLIDQQMHGLAGFKDCDRLRYPILRQQGEILSALGEVYQEAIGQRSELLARYDADDLAEYNQKADIYLPPIIVAVDEAASLLADKEIGAALKKQAWELRKFGVFQMLALTSVKGTVIDTDHRHQFSSKVQLHANDKGQARLLLDAIEAINFPPGRAVIDLPGLPPTVVQTPYIHKRELRDLLRPASQLPAPPREWVIEPDEPTDKQQAVLDLWDAGELNERLIAGVVYGPGGRQEELVRRTLEKFCRITPGA